MAPDFGVENGFRVVMNDLIDRLQRIVGEKGIISGPDLTERAVSYWDSSPTDAKALVRPESTQQVSDVLRVCHERGQPVVIQGGLTGVVEGELAGPDEIIISLERMTAIESVDAMDGVAVIQAGAVLQSVQEQRKSLVSIKRFLLFSLRTGLSTKEALQGYMDIFAAEES